MERASVMENPKRKKIGEFSQLVIDTLQLDVAVGTPIYVGESNLRHMSQRHPKAFKKYGDRISRVISEADWVALADDSSVEFVKMFGQHIKVAVRISVAGDYYARTLFHVEPNLANNKIKQGYWKPIEKSVD